MFELNEGATVRSAEGRHARQGRPVRSRPSNRQGHAPRHPSGPDLQRRQAGIDRHGGPYGRLGWNFGTAAIWRYPTVAAGLPPYPAPPAGIAARPVRVVTERNDDDDSVVIGEDTPVVSADGEKVGDVTEVIVDADGNLACLVIDTGLLSGERVLPSHWIESVTEASVKPAVDESLLEKLGTPA